MISVLVARLAALVCVVLVAGCTALYRPNVEATPLAAEPVDGRYFLTWIDHGDGIFGIYRVWNFIRVFPSDGRVGVCGAYVADIEPERAEKLQGSYAAERSYLDINGVDFSRPGIRFNPGFMRFARRGGDDHHELIRGVEAGCIRLERPWDATLANPKLALNLRLNL